MDGIRKQMRRRNISNLVRVSIGLLLFVSIGIIYSVEADAQSRSKCKRGSRSAKCLQPSSKMPKTVIATNKPMNQTNSKKLNVSEWADAGIQLSVLSDKVEIVFNCADAAIPGGFLYSDSGDFSLTGAYTPVLDDRQNRLAGGVSVPAQFIGKLSGNEMELKVLSADGRMVFAEHTLSKDTVARIRRCG